MKNDRPFDISNYNDPGQYRHDCLVKGVGVSTSFCLAVSKVMEKHNLTFPEACHFLEDKDFLFWAGDIPIYNLAGDTLWMDEES